MTTVEGAAPRPSGAHAAAVAQSVARVPVDAAPEVRSASGAGARSAVAGGGFAAAGGSGAEHEATAPAVGPTRGVAAVLRPWLGVLGGVAILAVVGWRLGVDPLVAGLRGIDAGSLAAALAVGVLTTVCNAARWRIVARRLGLPLRLRTAVADCYQAQFLNTVLPAGVLGDIGRAVGHGRAAGDVGRGARAVVLERVAGHVVLAAAGVAVLVAHLPAAPVLLAAAIVVAAAVLVTARRRARRTMSAAPGSRRTPGADVEFDTTPAGRAPRPAWCRTRRAAARGWAALRADVRAGLLDRRAWPAVLGLSAVALAGYVALFVVAARATGATAPIATLLPVLLLALFAMALPAAVGGWGPREAVAALGFGAAGLGAAQGAAAAVGYGVLTLVATAPGLVVLLARRLRPARGAS